MKVEGNMSPLVKKDVQDFFPQTRSFYPGYIRQEIFRVKLTDAMGEALMRSRCATDSITNRGAEMRAAPSKGPFITASYGSIPVMTSAGDNRPSIKASPVDPSWSTNVKTELLRAVERIEWRPVPQMRDFAAEMRREANVYFKAATSGMVDDTLDKIGGKVVKQVRKTGGQQLGKMIAKGTVNKKLGQGVGKYGLGSIVKKEYKLQPKGFSAPLIDVDIDINLPDTIVGGAMNQISNGIPSGIEVNMNNEHTRRWLTEHTGLSDAWAGRAMDVVDLVLDYVPIAATTKMAEETLVNVGMGVYYRIQARSIEQGHKRMEETFKDFNMKLRASIRQDVLSLSETEILQLAKLLGIK